MDYYLPPPQIECISAAIHAEARGEPLYGKFGVANVIINRSKKQNKTPCEIVKQPNQFKLSWGFRYTMPDRDYTNGSLYFKTTKSKVKWQKLTYMLTIGNHMFYK